MKRRLFPRREIFSAAKARAETLKMHGFKRPLPADGRGGRERAGRPRCRLSNSRIRIHSRIRIRIRNTDIRR